jgi:Ca-activated chloride channel family protein
MSYVWPGFLVLLGLIPLMVVVYILMLRRRRRFAVRYSSLSLVRDAIPRQSWLRRHLPFVLFLLAVTSLVLAMGRPEATVSVPSSQTIIVLAIDVSRSMCGTDIPPNRLEAAKQAALSFVESQDPSTQISIVAFAGFSEVLIMPTNDQELLEEAILSLRPARRTAVGSGIMTSIDVIAEIDPTIAPSVADPFVTAQPEPVPDGEFAPHIIVVLTDGVTNSGPFPMDAAQQAEDRGVRIFTIGFGTDDENTVFGGPSCYSDFGGGGFQFGGGGGGGGGFRRRIDEETLKQIADLTGGEYYAATSASELQDVFQGLPAHYALREETMEISVIFTAIGAFFAAFAILLALLWHPLP